MTRRPIAAKYICFICNEIKKPKYVIATYLSMHKDSIVYGRPSKYKAKLRSVLFDTDIFLCRDKACITLYQFKHGKA